MACGSLMAGLAMNISDCTAEHSLAQAIASVRHAPHGLTIGVVLPQRSNASAAHVAGQLERVADALRLSGDGSPTEPRRSIGFAICWPSSSSRCWLRSGSARRTSTD